MNSYEVKNCVIKNIYKEIPIVTQTITGSNNVKNEFTVENSRRYTLNIDLIETYTEKYVHSLLMDYCKKNKRELDKTIFAEFFFINMNINSSRDFDLYNYEKRDKIIKIYTSPLSTCVLFLDNSEDNAFIITNIDNEKYKYKIFSNESELYITYPKRGYQISFDGGKYYGKVNTTNIAESSYALIINISNMNDSMYNKKQSHWTHLQYVMKYFSFSYSSFSKEEGKEDDKPSKEQDAECITTTHDIEDAEFFNFAFFENLLYKKEIEQKKKIVIWNSANKSAIVHIKKPKEAIVERSYVDDLKDIMDASNNRISNRFTQRFIVPKMYSQMTCDWILDEISKNAINTVVMIEKLPILFSYISFSFKKLVNDFISSYSLKKDSNLSIKAGIITKYTEPHNNKRVDGFSCNIILSKSANILFEDGLSYHLKQGDMIFFYNQPYKIHSVDEKEFVIMSIDVFIPLRI